MPHCSSLRETKLCLIAQSRVLARQLEPSRLVLQLLVAPQQATALLVLQQPVVLLQQAAKQLEPSRLALQQLAVSQQALQLPVASQQLELALQ